MRCPDCNSAWSKVTNTRRLSPTRTKRYRVCMHCHRNFQTYEVISDEVKPKTPKKSRKDKSSTEEIDDFDELYVLEDDEEEDEDYEN